MFRMKVDHGFGADDKKSKLMGTTPATVVASETVVLELVTSAKTTPCKFVGRVASFLLLIGTIVEPRPDSKARKNDPWAAPAAVTALGNVTVTCSPGLPEETVNGGKGVAPSGGLVDGQETKNPWTMEIIWFGSRGTSKDPLHGVPWKTELSIHPAWRASVLWILPAVVLSSGVERRGPLPRYAETPPVSRAPASATNDLASVSGKE